MAAADFENDGRKYQINEILETDQGNMLVHGISYQEDEEGNRKNFSYILRHEEDVKAEQKAAAVAAKAAAQPATETEAQA
jgi:hypothetical protein